MSEAKKRKPRARAREKAAVRPRETWGTVDAIECPKCSESIRRFDELAPEVFDGAILACPRCAGILRVTGVEIAIKLVAVDPE